MTATAMRVMIMQVGHGVLAVLAHWSLYVVIGSAIVGVILVQQALKAGDLPAPVAVITVGNPLLSIALGILWLGESIRTTPLPIATQAVGIAAVVAGVVVLAAQRTGATTRGRRHRTLGTVWPPPAGAPERRPADLLDLAAAIGPAASEEWHDASPSAAAAGRLGTIVREIETDFLVIGAGASAMAFVDALLAESDARVVLVDRRHAPGGHWLDAYPFVRLHQPSANYGVTSRRLGHDRIDRSGVNDGFYERATADEICDYYGQLLEQDFIGSGRVRFLGMSEYRGEDLDGHHVVSLLTGADTTVRARKVVDATYVQSEIPSRRRPDYEIDPGVRVIAPNDLVDVQEAPDGFTVVGAGKTAMDTCCWLLEAGVDPELIRWIRPRDPWLFDRAFMQPLELVGSFMQMQAHWVEAAAAAVDGGDFAHRLESSGVFVRIDPAVEPQAWRGATISTGEIDALRSITRVERGGYVRRIRRQSLVLSRDGVVTELPTTPNQLYVDCTAPGVRPTAPRPVFSGDRILLQYVTIGFVPWSAATIGYIEATRDDDREKNRLCPVLTFEADVAGALRTAYAGMSGLAARGAESDLNAWTEACRLNAAAGAMSRLADPDVAGALTTMVNNFGPAMANLAQRVGATSAGRLEPV